jgi:hypothetical protein
MIRQSAICNCDSVAENLDKREFLAAVLCRIA